MHLHEVPNDATFKAVWMQYTAAAPRIAKALMLQAHAKKAVQFDFSYKLPLKLTKATSTLGNPAHVDSEKALALVINEIGQWMYVG